MDTTFARSGNIRLETTAETQTFAEELGRHLEAGDVIILDGPLGAGKTTFTQGLARGLNVKGRVTSPTFVIAREHKSLIGGPSLVHVDAYRLIDAADATDPIGALDSLDLETELEDAVVVAEWGGGLVEQITDSYLLITFDRTTANIDDPDSEARIVTWKVIEP
ncbi:tRNA (adenosine(37)-N6)-threonylcarbamoyltransferase complex ATPase subunit type 1 TsaE [Corynebacterium belfantii]|uniref:tRNA (adenosine(37)-N6)-threonylcarbamoyltransferase complex ATPase subunit type 1 TsaE n=1 Tax=Corynebacterium belfantii TaxID=2014537 RepID=UPI0018CAA20A|nr:tRNA (adenosine(37)-N6)-threonylcarbamoyltransferase complex ATPase subunit type 1 TsaE [Corynebacterium belfantii]MBG9258189.1 tRNA (adenosine(37)-N6)-threonylcarbamoyltransferase complex ATPase subunit type 1 TsaE [Corynebacterium belfantii]MBG9264744.1 tRNA (adenosine(37)-N6)-threonylcarbamoyltransferase complex ATPase subunit type 1 TsaE [Corynebacterium belfantii]MBG9297879.1 tRNA (adenosine(37)-N6)-threonylcarbamoyltransferase complex ATPase subunit type 1 TsaE [Corynebacterium belfanti